MKLDQLHAAIALDDCRRRTARGAERRSQGRQHPINDQWRVCFEWPKESKGPLNVEILDYH
ncbi:MAG: plasmid maintenance system killer protein [Proteobacteria bacterium]|nr:plasmid maintenance system killer protein [Pseudomonadota bacterium]